MNRRRLFMTGALTLALAFGIWTMAISFTPISSSFNAGDEVSASTFNQLFADIDSNFNAVAAEFDNKVSTAGDNMTGLLHIEGNTGTSDPALRVINTNADGISALIASNSTEPALAVKNSGTGPLFAAVNGSLGGLKVANDGSIIINPDNNTDTISLDAVSGDINITGSVRNEHGKALTPIAYGVADSSGTLQTGSGNISVTRNGVGNYLVEITGENYRRLDYVSVATAFTGVAEVGDVGGRLLIKLFDYSGNPADTDFNFVTYKP